MTSKLNKKELKKMLAELNAELKSVTNEAKYFKEQRRTIVSKYEEDAFDYLNEDFEDNDGMEPMPFSLL